MPNNLLSRWLGRDKWPYTTASIYSVEYVKGSRDGGNRDMASGWRVVYTYRVDGELYTGNYFDGAPNSTDVDTLFNPAQDSTNVYALKPDDTIEICYNPRQPAKNVYPNADSISLYGMAPWLIGAALALTVGLIVFFTRVSK